MKDAEILFDIEVVEAFMCYGDNNYQGFAHASTIWIHVSDFTFISHGFKILFNYHISQHKYIYMLDVLVICFSIKF